ncbi:hypothetical protein NZL82_18580 [Sphingomonas sanguinis]|jgi:hypothetical protein|uniref:hypothetical protein n=1 Tax=Sphingomonas sp. LC-1 TaxID=3110957 RepID=UPI0021BAE59B|nr:hypothetical protein [Sphingomonas sp. LC-1]MCT8003879.1 hypothetical protein [Sphingomonas sp. LC-1]
MASENSIKPSRRAILGSAGGLLAVPLVADHPAHGTASAPRAKPLASFAELAASQGADGVGTKRGSLGSVTDMLALDARAHGVIGDGHADDTKAVRALLDACARQGGRIAYFGQLTVRITGPLVSRGVGIVFDTASYGGEGAPGFIASGTGYTVLTVSGSVPDFCLTITGEGRADIEDSGRIAGDRRARINGIDFGTNDAPFAMANVRWVRVHNLAGYGIRHTQCWDCTFLSVSVERCGREGVYAFEVVGDARRSCNETTWVRLHVEQSIGGAIRIDPGTLSCTFSKIHSERAIPSGSMPTWLFGGSCIYDSARLTALDPAHASVSIIGNQMDVRNLRAEGEIRVIVNASGGTITFHNPGAVLQPAPNQNGIVNIVGGVISLCALGAGWNLIGCQIGRLEVGFMSPGQWSTLTGCAVGELVPQDGVDQGELVLNATRVASATIAAGGRLRALHLTNNSRLTAKDGMLVCRDQFLGVDTSSRIEGNVSLRRASLRLAGVIAGQLGVDGAVHDARAEDTAIVEKGVTGWGSPTIAGTQGAWSVNLMANVEAPMKPRPGGGRQAIMGWRYVAHAWRPVRIEIEE